MSVTNGIQVSTERHREAESDRAVALVQQAFYELIAAQSPEYMSAFVDRVCVIVGNA